MIRTYQDALGKWITFDGTYKYHFETEGEAKQMANILSVPTAAEEMAATIIKLLPQLKGFYSELNDMTADWYVNGIPKQIEEAVAAAKPLGGYDPVMFIVMGEVFKALKAFMQAPVTVPPEVLKGLGLEAITPEFAVRYKWLPAPVVPDLTPTATYQPVL